MLKGLNQSGGKVDKNWNSLLFLKFPVRSYDSPCKIQILIIITCPKAKKHVTVNSNILVTIKTYFVPLFQINVWIHRSSHERYSSVKLFLKHAANLQENTHVKVQFQWSCMQRYWNRGSTRVFSCKFTVYFWNTFL